jgi:hypothetical protein
LAKELLMAGMIGMMAVSLMIDLPAVNRVVHGLMGNCLSRMGGRVNRTKLVRLSLKLRLWFNLM